MKCKNCDNEHDGSFGSGRFCSRQCANSRHDDKTEIKIICCIECGNDIKVNKRSRVNTKCKECKKLDRIRKYSRVKKVTKRIIVCKYCGEEKCKRIDICQKHQLLPSLIKYFGFNGNVIGTKHFYKEFERVRTILIEDYWNREMSIPELVKKYNHYDNRNFNKILNTLEIEKRTLSESQINGLKNGKWSVPHCKYPYKFGWHITWDNKKVFYRSSYELNYCLELDRKKIKYELESLRILYWDSQQNKQRVAIPDFYLPETNEIIEIKSEYTYNERNMKDKFKVYKNHGYKSTCILAGVTQMVE